MSSTYLSLHYHIVFSTKDRRPLISSKWRSRLHEYLGGTVRGLGGIPEAIGGVGDHVHLLIGLKATHCLADFMRELKKASSTWAAENHEPLIGWQEGYSAFSASYSLRDAIREYITRQEAHHRKTNFIEDTRTPLGEEWRGVQAKIPVVISFRFTATLWHPFGVHSLFARLPGVFAWLRPPANSWQPFGLRCPSYAQPLVFPA